MLRLHVISSLLAYSYYNNSIIWLINCTFLFNISIALLLFSLTNYSRKFYSSKWILFYFLFICSFFFLFFFFKFVIVLNYYGMLSSDITGLKPGISTYFSNTIVCLSFLTSIITWIYLSERHMYKSHFFILYFFIFIMCTINMVHTSNLLVMFIYFEFIFLPSLFFVYQFAYSKKVDKTISFLLKWTLSGSFLVLLAIVYIYAMCSTLDIYSIQFIKFSYLEKFFLFFTIFIGFGIKIPVWPFYYWLTKVHVEAPAGFSIFLSGFLVKTSFFCLAFFVQLLSSGWSSIFAITIIIWGAIDSSIRMWTSTDIKKLVAFATIQEMNLIMLLLFISNDGNYNILSLFLLVHGVLSSLFFYLVDQIQKNFSTRNILSLSGTILFLPTLATMVWCALLVFRGFPLFIKFFIEWEILSLIVSNFSIIGALFFLLISIFGVLGFSRVWFSVLYGQPQQVSLSKDMLRIDFLIGCLLFFFLFFLSFSILYF